MRHTILDHLGLILFLSGGAVFLYFLIRTAARMEKTRTKRQQLMERALRLKEQLDEKQ